MSEATFTFDYFRDEFCRFWEMCGQRTVTLEQLQRAFNGLFFVASRTTASLEESRRIATLLTTAAANFEHRAPFFLLKDLRKDQPQ
jgi:hypothetical protein